MIIIKHVGCKYLRYIIEQIKLRTIWGRWCHVLGYTVSYIFEYLDNNNNNNIINNNDFDSNLISIITNIMLHDCVGSIGAEKLKGIGRYRGKEALDSRLC